MLYAIVKINESGEDLISIATTEEEAIELRNRTCKEYPDDEVEVMVYDENQYDGYIRHVYCGSAYDYIFNFSKNMLSINITKEEPSYRKMRTKCFSTSSGYIVQNIRAEDDVSALVEAQEELEKYLKEEKEKEKEKEKERKVSWAWD